MSTVLAQIEQNLQNYLKETFPERQMVQVQNVTIMTKGWENEIISFDLVWGPENERLCEPLVLRIYPGKNAYAKSAHEFRSMNLLYDAGYPVPRVWKLEHGDSPFGKPFVLMERITGKELWSYLVLPNGEPQQKHLNLFCDLFLRLHRLDWRPFAGDMPISGNQSPYVFIDQWLHNAHASLKQFDKPGFLPVLQWLEVHKNQAACSQPAVLHGDFHPANILLRADGSPAVIDWAGLHVSDARFDQAWTFLLARAYMGQAWHEHFRQTYESLAGEQVEALEYFEICASVRRLFDIVVSVTEGPEKLGMLAGAADIMRSQIEVFDRIHDFLVEHTGIKIPEAEQLLWH